MRSGLFIESMLTETFRNGGYTSLEWNETIAEALLHILEGSLYIEPTSQYKVDMNIRIIEHVEKTLAKMKKEAAESEKYFEKSKTNQEDD